MLITFLPAGRQALRFLYNQNRQILIAEGRENKDRKVPFDF
jgi:hypothetical protein